MPTILTRWESDSQGIEYTEGYPDNENAIAYQNHCAGSIEILTVRTQEEEKELQKMLIELERLKRIYPERNLMCKLVSEADRDNHLNG